MRGNERRCKQDDESSENERKHRFFRQRMTTVLLTERTGDANRIVDTAGRKLLQHRSEISTSFVSQSSSAWTGRSNCASSVIAVGTKQAALRRLHSANLVAQRALRPTLARSGIVIVRPLHKEGRFAACAHAELVAQRALRPTPARSGTVIVLPLHKPGRFAACAQCQLGGTAGIETDSCA